MFAPSGARVFGGVVLEWSDDGTSTSVPNKCILKVTCPDIENQDSRIFLNFRECSRISFKIQNVTLTSDIQPCRC